MCKKLWKLDYAEQGIVYKNDVAQWHEFYDLGIDEDGEIFLVNTIKEIISIFSPNQATPQMQVEWAI